MSTVVAWTMKDGGFTRSGLYVHLLLVDQYFIVGTQWPDEEIGWYTRVYSSTEAAQHEAVHHTGMLEKTGDTMERGPFALATGAKDQATLLAELVDKDQPSAVLDYLFSQAMLSAA